MPTSHSEQTLCVAGISMNSSAASCSVSRRQLPANISEHRVCTSVRSPPGAYLCYVNKRSSDKNAFYHHQMHTFFICFFILSVSVFTFHICLPLWQINVHTYNTQLSPQHGSTDQLTSSIMNVILMSTETNAQTSRCTRHSFTNTFGVKSKSHSVIIHLITLEDHKLWIMMWITHHKMSLSMWNIL